MKYEIQEAILKVIEWESEEETIPFVCMDDVREYLEENYNKNQPIDFDNETNWWELYFFFQFPLDSWKVLCFEWSVFYLNTLKVSLSHQL